MLFHDTPNHTELCKLGAKWLKRHQQNAVIPNCSTVATEMVTIERKIPDIIGWNSHASVLIEIKVSRSDFLKDKSKPFRINPEKGVGEYRYYLCPEGLVKEDELPANWGLLYFKENKFQAFNLLQSLMLNNVKNTTFFSFIVIFDITFKI